MFATTSLRTACLAATSLLMLGMVTPAAHAARTFCCIDEKGQQRCGDVLPDACRSRAYVEYNEAGVRVRNVERPLTEAEQAVRDAEDKKQREIAEAQRQQQRADRALLSTYADEKDLDTARDRVVGELERSIKSAETKLAELNKTKTKLEAETEFYKNKRLPEDLKRKMERNKTAIADQVAAIEVKRKDVEENKAKFEAYRQRLRELKSGDKADDES